MNDPKSLGTYNSNAPVAPGSNVASVVMPESNVWYPPLTNVVNVFVSPLQFFLKTKSTLTKSDLLPPIFFISPLKTILPCASFFFCYIAYKNTICRVLFIVGPFCRCVLRLS